MKLKLLLSVVIFNYTAVYCNAQSSGEKLITAFRQGSRGNCASIALIKAAISVYGLNNVFYEKVLPDGKLEATLKNGKKYILTPQELKMAEISADFKKKNPTDEEIAIIAYAVKCYAVMAKVREEIHGFSSYEDALKRLDRGAFTPTVYLFLGLENKVTTFRNGSNVDDKCGIVCWRTKHAVYACNGYIDEWGKKNDLTKRYYGRFQVLQ